MGLKIFRKEREKYPSTVNLDIILNDILHKNKPIDHDIITNPRLSGLIKNNQTKRGNTNET
jgi:hypothetical protein